MTDADTRDHVAASAPRRMLAPLTSTPRTSTASVWRRPSTDDVAARRPVRPALDRAAHLATFLD